MGVLALIAHAANVPDEPLKVEVTVKEASPDLKTEKEAALEQREIDNDNEESSIDSLKGILRSFIEAGLDVKEAEDELEEFKREPWGRRRCTNSICRRSRRCQRNCSRG